MKSDRKATHRLECDRGLYAVLELQLAPDRSQRCVTGRDRAFQDEGTACAKARRPLAGVE